MQVTAEVVAILTVSLKANAPDYTVATEADMRLAGVSARRGYVLLKPKLPWNPFVWCPETRAKRDDATNKGGRVAVTFKELTWPDGEVWPIASGTAAAAATPIVRVDAAVPVAVAKLAPAAKLTPTVPKTVAPDTAGTATPPPAQRPASVAAVPASPAEAKDLHHHHRDRHPHKTAPSSPAAHTPVHSHTRATPGGIHSAGRGGTGNGTTPASNSAHHTPRRSNGGGNTSVDRSPINGRAPYARHLSVAEANELIERGELYRAQMRINAKNPQQAFASVSVSDSPSPRRVPRTPAARAPTCMVLTCRVVNGLCACPGGGRGARGSQVQGLVRDVYFDGFRARNRALEGDIVAVRVRAALSGVGRRRGGAAMDGYLTVHWWFIVGVLARNAAAHVAFGPRHHDG